MLVSVIVPVYKKEEIIQKNIKQIYNSMSGSGFDFELIFVIDGFLDKSYSLANEYLQSNPEIAAKTKIVGYKNNRGKGHAVRYGMARALGDLIVTLDAGMEIHPSGIFMLLAHMDWYDADIVVASKRHPASTVNYTFLRKIYSLGYQMLVFTLFRLKIKDTQTGLKIYKREVLEAVLPRLVVKEYAFDIEVIAVANRLGYSRIYEAPVNLTLDLADSRFTKLVIFDPFIKKMMRDTIAVFYRMNFLKYYDDEKKQMWVFDDELMMKVNTGYLIDPEEDFFENHLDIPDDQHLKFSVIIPVRGINDYLKENIHHLKRQNYKNFEVKIILDYEEEYQFNDPRFELLSVGPLGPGEKRNIGAAASSGDVLVFLDDDAYPSKNWLVHAAKIFNQEDIYALGAPAVTPFSASFLERNSGRVLESFLTSGGTQYRHNPSNSREIDDYPTVNFFVTKEAFDAVGGFTKEFWPGEDTKLALDLVEHHNKNFYYHPAPIVFHHRRDLFRPHLKQISRYAMHRGQFARLFPGNSRKISYFVPSLFVLGLFLGPLVALIFPVLWLPYGLVVLLYMGLIVYEASKIGLRDKSLLGGVFSAVGIFLTHLVYGFNFIVGLVKKPKLKLKKFDSSTGNYTEG